MGMTFSLPYYTRFRREADDGSPASKDTDKPRGSYFPSAFLVVVSYAGAWIVFDSRGFDWQAVATVATLFMTLFNQRAEHLDTQAIHAKLDELLRVEGQARDELTSLDHEGPEVIEEHRARERDDGG